MHFLHLTLLYCILTVFSSDPALEYSPSSPTKVLKSFTANPTTTNDVESVATNIIFQSKDGGQTWHDISQGLPENEQPEGFFAGESDVYLRVKNIMYRSKSNLKTPVWEKENVLDPRSTSIAFNPSGVQAYNYEGQIYQKMPSTGTWSPIYTNFRKQLVRTIFETSDGTVFLGCENGLYKSADRGQSWKLVLNEGWVMDIVESEGVLIGTGQKGIMRSTDNGEHWQWVISEGGVGIAVERIDSGFAAISFSTRTQSRRIRISLDSGKTWKAIDEGLQPSLGISSIKQMGEYLICGHPDGIFRSSDMGKTWNIVHSGIDKKVFKIYASGNMLYAVLRDLGC
ncbi:exo-alpha-sialidase [Fulvivirgaceae bacterium BMA10]|uniref:Exo-alpha-sialidase n=1 Tax=Splendidivirga corallicola TaxID=3051826 RepID=A0ABT8KP53_9BACT|nr:exo-alpha-sialidase [Fulvivirgaceae bacterium BMA10]